MMKKFRLWCAIILGVSLTFYFLDFARIMPLWMHATAHIQFVPALLAGSVGILAILLLLTLLFGRIYCSVICPMGIFQDVVSWLSKKKNKRKSYAYSREKRVIRYAVLTIVTIAFLGGGTIVLSLLDPYSAFGRIATNIFRPVYMAGNNLLASIFNHFGNYTFYHTDLFVLSGFAFIIALLTFGIIAFLSWRHGRSWCNTMCPVGTLLGVISRFSFWKIRIDPYACSSCGLCERKCKASCINSREKEIDHSRCVTCYNCLISCQKKAITYSLNRKKSSLLAQPETDHSRRGFVATLAALSLLAPKKIMAQNVAVAKNNHPWQRKHPLTPPGAISAKHLQKHCTACHLCVSKCPSRVLKPAFTDYGLAGMMQPKMDFEHGFCNFDCVECSNICPNGALQPLKKEEKHRLQVGRVVFVIENCIVNTESTSCGACSEHCPTQAVSMVAYKNGLTIPSVNPDLCVGCGGCEYVCPVRPFRAIYIEGNPVHQQAIPFKEAEKKEVELDGFGF